MRTFMNIFKFCFFSVHKLANVQTSWVFAERVTYSVAVLLLFSVQW